MFKLTDNLFFGRTDAGKVRILKFAGPPQDYPSVNRIYPDAALDLTVDAWEWASIVAYVSEQGENNFSWKKALLFHQGMDSLSKNPI